MKYSKTYYDILGVAPDASQDAIRTAFRSAAKRYHPDLCPSYIQKVRATAKMQEINAAYALLKNPDSRRKYDTTLPKRGAGVIDPMPSQDSKTQQPTSKGSGTVATGIPRHHRPFRMEPTAVWMLVVWLIASFAWGYLTWNHTESMTLGAFLLTAAYSLLVSPFIVMIIFWVLMPLVVYIMKGFYERSEFHQRAMPSRNGKIVLDMLLRLAGLAAVVGIGFAAWHYNFTPELLFFALIAVGGSLIGEIAAMILYLSRRSVMHSTEMLLRMNPEP
jgi:hypothetical protein